MKKILIPTKLNLIAKKTLESHGNYQVVQDDSKDIEELISEHSDVHGIIVRSEKITSKIIDALPNL